MQTLDRLCPAGDERLDHELSQLLLYLRAPDAVAKSVSLLSKAATQEEQTYYAMRLRNITNGWTLQLRKDYLDWFKKKRDPVAHRRDVMQAFRDVGLDYSDGSAFQTFLDNFLKESFATMSVEDRRALALYSPSIPADVVGPLSEGNLERPKFFRQWRMQDLAPDLNMLAWHRSRARGRTLFNTQGCILCHRFANKGGSVGPDLSGVSSRLTPTGILESILDPSKVLPEQYQNVLLTLQGGDVLTGRVMNENEESLVFKTDLIHGTTVEIPKKDIVSRRLSKVLPMPEGLLNSLKEDEIWDLVAYLMASGQSVNTGSIK